MKKKWTLFLGVLLVVGCAKSSKDEAAVVTNTGIGALSAMSLARSATAAAGTDPNGLTLGSDVTVSTSDLSPSAAFSAETSCSNSGVPVQSDRSVTGWIYEFLLCSVLKSPDGPDTVRGGFDRISGFLCAIGSVTFDGQSREIDLTFSTTCFSQTFTTTACTFVNGSASDGPCTTKATVAGSTTLTGVAPSSFDQYLTVTMLNDEIKYTIAYSTTATTISGAAMGGLPATAEASVEDAFAFHIDSSTGNVRYEGRFDKSGRHIRINMLGVVSTGFVVSNVESLSFVQAENFVVSGQSGGAGLLVSISGTPAAGRKIVLKRTTSFDTDPIVWTAIGSDDGGCVGESGAACSGNSGIASTGTPFFFHTGSGFTNAKTWFTANSYLGSVSNTVDTDDIWD